MPRRPGRIVIVAPYGAINAAGDLGLLPATVGRVRTRVLVVCSPSRAGANCRRGGATVAIVRECPW